MTLSMFLMLLLMVSTFTGLVTEAVKKWMRERGIPYRANALAGYVAAVLAVATNVAYVILAGAMVNARMAVYLIALVFLSWLAAMVGYDKVIQAISQLRVYSPDVPDRQDQPDNMGEMRRDDQTS